MDFHVQLRLPSSHPLPTPPAAAAAAAPPLKLPPQKRFLLLLHPRRLVPQCHAGSHTTFTPASDSISHLHACSSALAITAAFNKVLSSSSSTRITLLPSKSPEDDHLSCSPSDEFLALCHQQLELCRTILRCEGNFTVYVRCTESYKSSELKLQCVACHAANSVQNLDHMGVLNFVSENQTPIRESEIALTQFQVVELPEHGASVLPMVKGSILLGVLVAEWVFSQNLSESRKTFISKESHEEEFSQLKQPPRLDPTPSELVETARCLALACVLDQRTVLLQQSLWKKSVRIDNLFEQVQGPLTTIRTLGKLLLTLLKRSEISRDVVEDILVQGDRMKDILSHIQEDGSRLVQLKQDLIDMYENPRKKSGWGPTFRSRSSVEESRNSVEDPLGSIQPLVPALASIDKELPMPPLTLTPPYNKNIRTCDVSDVLLKLVKAASGLALKRHQTLELHSPHVPLIAAVEENILYHAFSRLLDGALQHSPSGGWVQAEVMHAPSGGVLVIIEDNGPDISVAIQAQILSPLGSSLKAFARESDENVTLKFGEEIAVSREILESYGIVLHIKSPHLVHAPVGNGGIRLEIWLPSPSSANDSDTK